MSDRGEDVALELLTKGWDGLMAGHGRGLLEAALPTWMTRQRWFGAKTRTVTRLRIADWVEIPVAAAGAILAAGTLPSARSLGDALLMVELDYVDGGKDRYQVPIGFTTGASVTELRATAPWSVVITVDTPTGEAVFHDATVREELRQALLGLIERGASLPVQDAASASAHVAATIVAAHQSRPAHEISADQTGEIAAAIKERHSIDPADVAPEFVGHMRGAAYAANFAQELHTSTTAELTVMRSGAFSTVRGTGQLAARLSSTEQSNTNVIYGQRLIMKVFRRLEPGLNPDVEIGRFLTEIARFPRIAPFLGELTIGERTGEQTTLAMLQGLVANEGDGWVWMSCELAKYYANVGGQTLAEDNEASAFTGSGRRPAEVRGYARASLDAAALLGRRTAEMHLALATPTDNLAFAAESFSAEDLTRDALRIDAQINSALHALQAKSASLTGAALEQAESVLAQRDELLRRARLIARANPSGQRIRIHGDYHLGQVLRAADDFVLLDFEGEPARSLAERRQKQSPLRDVAGMLRSFSYVAYAGLNACEPELRQTLAPWARAWEIAACSEFLDTYLEAASANAALIPPDFEAQLLLNGYVLEKALYELLYELNNRPTWVGIPLSGILALPA